MLKLNFTCSNYNVIDAINSRLKSTTSTEAHHIIIIPYMHNHAFPYGRNVPFLCCESIPHSGMWLLNVNAPPQEKYQCCSNNGTCIIIIIVDRTKPEKPL